MKIGVIGLGAIAEKAYLPVYAQMREKATFVLATRNQQKLQEIKNKYHFNEGVATIDELIQTGITACFVHAATNVHGTLVKRLLNAGIHVFVDKPLSDNLAEVKEIQQLAKRQNLLLMVGFNRRFAPFVEELKTVPHKNMIFLQKNRIHTEHTTRFVLYDLFLHVADTAVYLLDEPIGQVRSKLIEKDGHLQRAVLHLETAATTVIATMNLFSGANTETIQLMSESGTYIVEDLTEKTVKKAGILQTSLFNDWTPTLVKRGFQPMVEAFIQAVATQKGTNLKQENIYTSHELCAKMILHHQQHHL